MREFKLVRSILGTDFRLDSNSLSISTSSSSDSSETDILEKSSSDNSYMLIQLRLNYLTSALPPQEE